MTACGDTAFVPDHPHNRHLVTATVHVYEASGDAQWLFGMLLLISCSDTVKKLPRETE